MASSILSIIRSTVSLSSSGASSSRRSSTRRVVICSARSTNTLRAWGLVGGSRSCDLSSAFSQSSSAASMNSSFERAPPHACSVIEAKAASTTILGARSCIRASVGRSACWNPTGSERTLVPWYLYVAFIAFVIGMLLIDLRFFHAEEHEPTPRESATWVGIWVTLALAFGVVVFFWKGTDTGIEYFTGYLLEYSLSVDNMFVFVLIFTYFQVPFRYQHQVLFYGILGAMIFRGLFIVAGVSLIHTFDWIIYVFGAFLIITAVRIAISTEEVHPDENPILNFAKRRLPTTTKFDGQKMFTIENGMRVATPLFIVLLFIEMTDIVFAVDSIPPIFGITDDPFIILTSNVFAILGLRALYFLLADVIDRFHLLKYGLAIVLAFVGTKMLLEAFHIEIPVQLSLLVIVVVLGITTALSLLITPSDKDGEEAEKEAGLEAFAGGAGDALRETSEDEEAEKEVGG